MSADPHLPSPEEVARSVAADLQELYGDRLEDVVLFGSHARGDADDESDLDLLVVLDEVASPFDELRRMDDVVWRHTLCFGITVSAFAIGVPRWRKPDAPVLIAAHREGRSLR